MSFRTPNKQRDSPSSSNWPLCGEGSGEEAGGRNESWTLLGWGVAPKFSGLTMLSILGENNYGNQKKPILPTQSQNPLALVAPSSAELSPLSAVCPSPRQWDLVLCPASCCQACLADFTLHPQETLKKTALAVCQILTGSNTAFVLEYIGIRWH